MPSPSRSMMRYASLFAVSSALVLSACSSTPGKGAPYDPEDFNSTTTHTRNFQATEAQTCEAARRALLSQGYLVTAANPDLVAGRKSFQPNTEMHVEVELRVVCARDGVARGDNFSTVAFASALQDRYAIKKSNNSASVGVGAIGSLSLPFSSGSDSLVKVASETVTDAKFYDRFFVLLSRFLVPGAAETTPVAPTSNLVPRNDPPAYTPLISPPASPLASPSPVPAMPTAEPSMPASTPPVQTAPVPPSSSQG